MLKHQCTVHCSRTSTCTQALNFELCQFSPVKGHFYEEQINKFVLEMTIQESLFCQQKHRSPQQLDYFKACVSHLHTPIPTPIAEVKM